MLVGFSVANFRSFDDVQSCGFTASFDDAHEATHCHATGLKALPRLTRNAVIFGPNGAGKSNFLLALRTMREFVLRSHVFSDEQLAAAYTPYRLNSSADEPTRFGIELLLGGVRFHYAFAYDAAGIAAESLHAHHGRKPQRWFGRRREAGGRETWSAFSPRLNGPREAWRKATNPKSLFLTMAGRHKAPQLQDIVHWFEHGLSVLLTGDGIDPQALATRLGNPALKTRMLAVFRAVDIPIDDLRIGMRPPSASGGNRPGTVLELLHGAGGCPAWLDFAHESAGVQRLVYMLAPLLEAVKNGTFIAIDEFNRSLHPLVVRWLLQRVHDPTASDAHAQLMLTSHDMGLMDLDILRRDEIWLMETDSRCASRLTSLQAQSPRKHEKIAKNYLRGSFGAVPMIDLDTWGLGAADAD